MISSVSPSSPLLVYSLPNKCVRTEESAFNDRLFWSQLSNKVIRQCHDATGVLHLVGFSPQSLTIHTATAFSSIYHPKKKKWRGCHMLAEWWGFGKENQAETAQLPAPFQCPEECFHFSFTVYHTFFFHLLPSVPAWKPPVFVHSGSEIWAPLRLISRQPTYFCSPFSCSLISFSRFVEVHFFSLERSNFNSTSLPASVHTLLIRGYVTLF